MAGIALPGPVDQMKRGGMVGATLGRGMRGTRKTEADVP